MARILLLLVVLAGALPGAWRSSGRPARGEPAVAAVEPAERAEPGDRTLLVRTVGPGVAELLTGAPALELMSVAVEFEPEEWLADEGDPAWEGRRRGLRARAWVQDPRRKSALLGHLVRGFLAPRPAKRCPERLGHAVRLTDGERCTVILFAADGGMAVIASDTAREGGVLPFGGSPALLALVEEGVEPLAEWFVAMDRPGAGLDRVVAVLRAQGGLEAYEECDLRRRAAVPDCRWVWRSQEMLPGAARALADALVAAGAEAIVTRAGC